MERRPPDNLLLAALRPEERDALTARGRVVSLDQGQVLLVPGEPMSHAWFPIDSAISLMLARPGQPPIEVGLVGREGMLGVSVILGAKRARLNAAVQSAGRAWCIDASWLQECVAKSPTLRHHLDSYSHVRLLQLAQAVGCGSFHQIEGRLARWLLAMRDCTRRRELRVTHERLAQLLGARRAGVTLAANALRRRQLIRYARGRVVLLDFRGLEAAACGCYRADRRTYASVMR